MNKQQRSRTRSVLAALGLVGAVAAGAVAPPAASGSPAVQAAPDGSATAAAWETRVQNWSQVPGNRAGAVFHRCGDDFQLWEYEDGYASTIYWNYKGVDDAWRSFRVYDGGPVTWDLNLAESRNIYFIIQTDDHESPAYVSEYPVGGGC